MNAITCAKEIWQWMRETCPDMDTQWRYEACLRTVNSLPWLRKTAEDYKENVRFSLAIEAELDWLN